MASEDRNRTHIFKVHGRWSGEERSGEVGLGGAQTTTISVPAAFGGNRPGTNPEELLLASALACYLMTLSRTLLRRDLSALQVGAEITGEVSRTREGLRFDRILLCPVVHGAAADPAYRQRVENALLEAENDCFIARTLRPVIPYTLEPRFTD